MKTALLATVFALASVAASASAALTYCVGYEDNHGLSSDNDNNDANACVTGANIHSSGVWSNLTSPLALSNIGDPFWDHVSGDGIHANFGDEILGLGTYSAAGPLLNADVKYLATATGHMVSDVYFSGGAFIINLGGITGDHDKIGICYVANCGGTTTWITGPSLSFVASGNWEFVGMNGAGQESYSDAMQGQTSAFAIASGVNCPEPGSLWFAVAGLALVMCARSRRNTKPSR